MTDNTFPLYASARQRTTEQRAPFAKPDRLAGTPSASTYTHYRQLTHRRRNAHSTSGHVSHPPASLDLPSTCRPARHPGGQTIALPTLKLHHGGLGLRESFRDARPSTDTDNLLFDLLLLLVQLGERGVQGGRLGLEVLKRLLPGWWSAERASVRCTHQMHKENTETIKSQLCRPGREVGAFTRVGGRTSPLG